jgi:hypothetical protein
MLIPITFLLLLFGVNPSEKPAGDVSAVVGTWEGESKCMIPDSPCHDEHVIYEIKAGEKLTIDGYKVVDGEKQFMGTLECGPLKANQLSCTIPNKNKRRIDDWEFVINQDVMDGTLYMDKERTVFRKIHVVKK